MDMPDAASPSTSASPAPTASASSSSPSAASEQARIRRERREAKIRAGGSSRLDRITGIGGGRPSAGLPSSSSTGVSSPQDGTATPDPEEVDISTHHYTPGLTPAAQQAQHGESTLDEAQFRALMQPFDSLLPSTIGPGSVSPATPPPQTPYPRANTGSATTPNGSLATEADPMMALLQQMLSSTGGVNPGSAGGGGELPPDLAGMMHSLSGAPPPPATPLKPTLTWLFPILHTLFALTLGLYSAVSFPLRGTKTARLQAGSTPELSPPPFPHFLTIFLTVELGLQTARFAIVRANGGSSTTGGDLGPLAMFMGFIPPVYRGWIDMIVAYSGIYKRLISDVGIVLFCVGISGWIRTLRMDNGSI